MNQSNSVNTRMSYSYEDKFGYLPYELEFTFSSGKVIPLPRFHKAVEVIQRRTHTDHYVYPPRKSKSARGGASLHRLPSTHLLQLDKRFPDQEQARYGEGGFVMHLLGFLYGHRCHFHNWWIDGRVLVPGEIDHVPPSAKQAGELISRALETWHNLATRQRYIAINVLFLHTRTQMYEFEWERFSNSYLVFDAIYALARDTGILAPNRSAIRHEDRIGRIADQFGIPLDAEKVKHIVKLRNDLLHEALWDERMPGEARSEISFYASYWLHKLTKRAMFAVLGLKGTYIRTPWWKLNRSLFDL
jgi:hypothetical protein